MSRPKPGQIQGRSTGKVGKSPGGSRLFGRARVCYQLFRFSPRPGPRAGVNLGSSAYLRLPKTGNGERRRRLVKIGCLETLVSSKEGGEPQL